MRLTTGQKHRPINVALLVDLERQHAAAAETFVVERDGPELARSQGGSRFSAYFDEKMQGWNASDKRQAAGG